MSSSPDKLPDIIPEPIKKIKSPAGLVQIPQLPSSYSRPPGILLDESTQNSVRPGK